MKDVERSGRWSQPRASRRCAVSHASVRSTTHRRGRTWKPRWPAGRCTTSTVIDSRRAAPATRVPANPLSVNRCRSRRPATYTASRSRRPPAVSWTLAGVTRTASSRPRGSTAMNRFLPLTFVPASYPRLCRPAVSAPLELLTRSWSSVEAVSADEGAGQGDQSVVEVEVVFPPDGEAWELVEQGEGLRDDAAQLAQPRDSLGAAGGDDRDDAAAGQFAAQPAAVVAGVRKQHVRPAAGRLVLQP